MKKVFRMIGILMLVIALAFLGYALSHPEFGTVFSIGKIAIGASIWRIFYVVYAVIMAACFGISLFLKEKRR